MNSRAKRVLVALIVLSLAASGMLVVRLLAFNSWNYWYLNWNLFLAWLPLLFAGWLVVYLRKHGWLSWQGLTLTGLWLGFLPNSFYIATDLMHLQEATDKTLLFDVVLLLLFTVAGFIVGFMSVYLIHQQLLKRINRASAGRIITLVFLLCSFAIYLGRFLRWNTWDVLANPAGLILDISDRIINPVAHEQTFWITVLMFVLLGTLYFVIWEFAQALQTNKKP